MDRGELWRRVIRACTDSKEDKKFRRQLLVELWLHMQASEAADRNLFEKSKESVDRRRLNLDEAMTMGKAPAGSGGLLDLAAFAAVLDTWMANEHSWIGERRQGYGVWSIKAGKGRKAHWLVRRVNPLNEKTVRVRQRGLPEAVFRNFRVIPTSTAGGVAISVLKFPRQHALSVFKKKKLAVAAGVFSDHVRLSYTLEDRQFVVRGFKRGHERAREQSIEHHLSAAMGDPSVGVILYPEMSIPKELEARVLASVRAKLNDRREGQASSLREVGSILIIPGSFHHEPEDRNVNSASLYLVLEDGPPIELLRHCKFSRAWIPDGTIDPDTGARNGFMEKIDPSIEITLIATPLGLWAIAICMDFCSESRVVADIWDTLDVDVVFVPSLGNDTTLDLHRKRLSKLSLRQPTNVVLAQQMLPEEEDRGVVMAGDGLGEVPLQNGFHRAPL